jgi:NAD(P)-dependent dehydrogenase (short-subunit alcohol dehydrogenase family)
MSLAAGRRAVVTGGNRGIGREVCRQLAEHGYQVILAARRREQAVEAARRLDTLGHVVAAELDVADAGRIAAFEAWARGQLGSIDALVNNAGVSLPGFDLEVVRSTLAVNFFGPLHLTRALWPLLTEGATVVMVSSGMGELSAFSPELRARFLAPSLDVAGVIALVSEFEHDVQAGRHAARGWPSSAYRVSKAALNALTRALSRERSDLHINAVCPGWVKTDMGGPGANRSVGDGARGVVWAATLGADGPRAGFFRDGKLIPW